MILSSKMSKGKFVVVTANFGNQLTKIPIDDTAVKLVMEDFYIPDCSIEPIQNRALVVVDAEGADEPVNFEQQVHAHINFQPF